MGERWRAGKVEARMRKNTVLDGGYLLRKRSSRISQDFPSREDLKKKIQKGREEEEEVLIGIPASPTRAAERNAIP